MDINNIVFDNSDGNYLDKAFSDGLLPCNSIISKNITGIGATTTELNCNRNSIIVVDSRAIIDNKGAKNPNLLIVREGIKNTSIIQYLISVKINRKIMITPESFFKLIDACEILNIDLYTEFFILLDECDKIIKGASFRKEFPIFMDTFFKFKNKSMITATYIPPSDPRFGNFKVYNIIPKHHTPKTINLVLTNNTIFAAKSIIEKEPDKNWLIFVNSNYIIKQIINYTNKPSDCTAFCGKDYIRSYRGYTLNHIGTEIDTSKFKKYNFFTGRYFAGLDINVKDNYSILIISDPEIVKHSTLDPLTDVVQIIGRVRNKNAIKSIQVICNQDPNIDFFTEDELKDFFKSSEDDYNRLFEKFEKADNPNSKLAYHGILKQMPYYYFIDSNKKRSYFLLDCYTYFNKIKSYYKSYNSIKEAFIECKLYNSNLKYFEVKTRSKIWEFSITSRMLSAPSKIAFREKLVDLIEVIDAFKKGNIEISIDELEKNITLFKMIYQLYTESVSISTLKKCASEGELKELYLKHTKDKDLMNKDFVGDLYKHIVPENWYSSEELKEIYNIQLNKRKVKNVKATPRVYKMHFKIEEKSKKVNGKTIRGYEIKGYA